MTEKTRSWLHTRRDQREGVCRQVIDTQEEPAPSLTGKSGGQWQLRSNQNSQGIPGNRPTRELDEPALTILGSARLLEWRLRHNNQTNATIRPLDEPAATPFFGHAKNEVSWVRERPATTVVGSHGAGRIAAPGHHDTSTYNQPESVQITVAEALILQDFPPDHPVQGSRTKQFEQIGNAIPIRLARAVLGQLLVPTAPACAGCGRPESEVGLPAVTNDNGRFCALCEDRAYEVAR